MQLLFFICFSFLVACATGFGYTNNQLPLRDTHRDRWFRSFQSIAGGNEGNSRTNYGPKCANRATCNILDQVNPVWRYRPTYLETFIPFGTNVLIAFSQDDEGAGTDSTVSHLLRTESRYGSLQTTQASQSTLYTGIVVATGSGVANQALAEGTRVLLDAACTTRWTAATWTPIYGSEKATSMVGKFVNGVDLNNGQGWGYGWDEYADNLANTPHLTGITNQGSSTWFGNGNRYGGYPGMAGNPWIGPENNNDPSPTTNPVLNFPGGYPNAENLNQQSNYLVCPQTQIIGVVSEKHYADLEDSHYLKPSTEFRTVYGSKTPRNLFTQFTGTNSYAP